MTEKGSKPTIATSHSATTSVQVVDDIQSALSELLVGCAHVDASKIQAAISYLKEHDTPDERPGGAQPLLASFHETLWGLREEFDPSAVTMASTNIPDAILKLSAVLTETSESSHKVFSLIDKQNEVFKQSERYLAEIERMSQESRCDEEAIRSLIHRQRILNQAAQSLAHDVVMSQEFQDLCGQRIKKVVKLLCDVECYLRALFGLLKIELPSLQRNAEQKEQDQEMDQASADALLRQLGL